MPESAWFKYQVTVLPESRASRFFRSHCSCSTSGERASHFSRSATDWMAGRVRCRQLANFRTVPGRFVLRHCIKKRAVCPANNSTSISCFEFCRGYINSMGKAMAFINKSASPSFWLGHKVCDYLMICCIPLLNFWKRNPVHRILNTYWPDHWLPWFLDFFYSLSAKIHKLTSLIRQYWLSVSNNQIFKYPDYARLRIIKRAFKNANRWTAYSLPVCASCYSIC